MALSYAQLITPKTRQQMRAQLLNELQGLGVVIKTGTGTGSLVLGGTPSATIQARVRIASSGEPGTATYEVSLDGGATYDAAFTVPLSGWMPVSSTGPAMSFLAGPVGAGTSFVAGDIFTFDAYSPSFPVTSWREGDVARTLVEIMAGGMAEASNLLAAIARGGIVTLAPGSTGAAGAWLDQDGQQVYSLSRNTAVVARGTVVLTDAASAGPFELAPGQLWFASTSGKRFQSANTANVTLPKGGTLSLPIAAESPGSSYNVPSGTITTMLTPLPGVTVNNPANPWRTQEGTDEESDIAYATRCLGRWASLGYGPPAASYDLWARTASSEVTRTRVSASSSVANQVDLIVAGTSGPVSAGAVTAVSSYITPRLPLHTTLSAANATAAPVTVAATLYGAVRHQTTALAEANAALQALFAVAAIGGTIYRSAIIEALMGPTGVENVALSTPASDVALTATQVATLSTNLTWSSL